MPIEPSETGATAEEVARKLVDSWCGAHLDSCDEEGSCCCPRESFEKDLAEIVAAAKRSAHLEDARAGTEERRKMVLEGAPIAEVRAAERILDALSRTGAK